MVFHEGNARVSFDDEDQRLITFLDDYHNKNADRIISIQKIKKDLGSEDADIRNRVKRFVGFQMVNHLENDRIEILPNLFESAIELREEPDYWKNCETWFKSRWWSLPVLFLIIVLPLIVQWIEMIKAVMQWLRFSD